MKNLLIIFISITNFAFAQSEFGMQIALCAGKLTKTHVTYNPAYFVIDYPNGDIPKKYGVCTDVVIRTLRKVGIDLQKEIHEDMKQAFEAYPQNWGLKYPDKNIDHRRVPNQMTYFKRKGFEVEISDNKKYLPGDIVAWSLGNGLTHIGVVSSIYNSETNNYLMVHNIGAGQVLEDCLFNYKIIGHYRLIK